MARNVRTGLLAMVASALITGTSLAATPASLAVAPADNPVTPLAIVSGNDLLNQAKTVAVDVDSYQCSRKESWPDPSPFGTRKSATLVGHYASGVESRRAYEFTTKVSGNGKSVTGESRYTMKNGTITVTADGSLGTQQREEVKETFAEFATRLVGVTPFLDEWVDPSGSWSKIADDGQTQTFVNNGSDVNSSTAAWMNTTRGDAASGFSVNGARARVVLQSNGALLSAQYSAIVSAGAVRGLAQVSLECGNYNSAPAVTAQ